MADVKLYLAEREEHRRRNRRRFRMAAVAVGSIALIAGISWMMFRSPFVAVDEIRILGNERVSDEEIRTALAGMIADHSFISRTLGLHYLFAWPAHQVIEQPPMLPKLERIEITRRFTTRRIEVSVTEREPVGIWCLHRKEPVRCYWFAQNGVLYAPAPEAEGNLIPAVSDYATENAALGLPVLAEEPMRWFDEILNVLAGSDLRVREIRYENPALQELRVSTYDGPAVYFSLRFSPAYTTEALRTLREDDAKGELRVPLSGMQYIDFRVKNRVYYQ